MCKVNINVLFLKVNNELHKINKMKQKWCLLLPKLKTDNYKIKQDSLYYIS